MKFYNLGHKTFETDFSLCLVSYIADEYSIYHFLYYDKRLFNFIFKSDNYPRLHNCNF